MITRVVQRKRPRRSALLAILGSAIAAVGLFAMVVVATVNDAPTADGCDIQVANKNLTDICTTTAGAKVRYIGDSNQTFGSSGTGTFNPFVRLQGSPTERGYNTDGTEEFDTKVGTWTHAILISEIPVRTEDGCVNCWELWVDINDGNSNKPISLNDMEIWFTENAELSGYGTTGFAAPATKEYDFAGNILINDVNQGSGRGDLRYMVPLTGITIPTNCNYGNPLCDTYFVLYSRWGVTPAGFPSDGGFEEWKVKVYPVPPDVSVTKTPDGGTTAPGTIANGANAVFTITVTNNGPTVATTVTVSDTLPTTNGLDWSVTSQGLNPGFTGGSACALSAADALSCTISNLASGGSYRVLLTSATTAANCGTINNTVTISAAGDINAANDSDSGSINVQCSAIQILKQSTKSGNPLVTQAGVVFSVTGPGSYSASVTDNGTGDEDSTIGEVCISGLVPGTYTVNETTPPDGYGGATQTNQSATAVSGTDCSGNPPLTANSAVFTNAPLADLFVQVEGQESGEIFSSITCVNSADESIGSVGDPTPVDPAELDVDGLEPDTYTCTIVVDP